MGIGFLGWLPILSNYAWQLLQLWCGAWCCCVAWPALTYLGKMSFGCIPPTLPPWLPHSAPPIFFGLISLPLPPILWRMSCFILTSDFSCFVFNVSMSNLPLLAFPARLKSVIPNVCWADGLMIAPWRPPPLTWGQCNISNRYNGPAKKWQ